MKKVPEESMGYPGIEFTHTYEPRDMDFVNQTDTPARTATVPN